MERIEMKSINYEIEKSIPTDERAGYWSANHRSLFSISKNVTTLNGNGNLSLDIHYGGILSGIYENLYGIFNIK